MNPCLVTCATASIRLPVHGDGHQVGRRRVVEVPQAVVHHLERPLALARGDVEADDGLRRLVLAAAPGAVVVVTGRAGAEEDETALGVHRHRPPDIGVAVEPPRFLFPRDAPKSVGDCGMAFHTHSRLPVRASNP